MATIYYTVPSECADSYYELETGWQPGECDRYIAEQAADDYHSNHDGWESEWPLGFALHKEEGGPAFASFTVEREAVPEFMATPRESV